MTVAFDFEDKKEEEDNSGKVKISPFSFQLCSHAGSSNAWVIVLPPHVAVTFYICFYKLFVGWDKPEALPDTLPRGPQEHGEISAKPCG